MFQVDWSAFTHNPSELVTSFFNLLRSVGGIAGGIGAVITGTIAITQWWKKRRAQNLIHRVEKAAKQSEEESIWELSPAKAPRWFSRRDGGLGLPIIVVGNLKGGVGKTVTSAYLSYCLSKFEGKRVLVIDLDYQGSLTDLLDKEEKTINASGVSKLLKIGNHEIIASNGVITKIPYLDGNLSLISASSLLAPLENQLQLEWLLEREKDDIRYRLAYHLKEEWVRDQYDVIIIDTPPRMTASTFNALTACSHVVIPTSLKRTSWRRVAPYIRLLTSIKTKFNPQLTMAGIVLTLTNNRAALTGPEQNIRDQFIDRLKSSEYIEKAMIPEVLGQQIPRLNVLAEADFQDETVNIYKRLTEQVWDQVTRKEKVLT